MNKTRVYIAGAMSGLTYEEANAWRIELVNMLLSHFEIMSPMRGQPKTGFENACAGECDHRFEMVRDINDIQRSDVVVARFALNELRSFGTAIELGICIPLHKPVIFVIDRNDKLMQHPFLIAFPLGIITHSLEDAADYLFSMFNL